MVGPADGHRETGEPAERSRVVRIECRGALELGLGRVEFAGGRQRAADEQVGVDRGQALADVGDRSFQPGGVLLFRPRRNQRLPAVRRVGRGLSRSAVIRSAARGPKSSVTRSAGAARSSVSRRASARRCLPICRIAIPYSQGRASGRVVS